MQKVTESGGRAWENAYDRIRELILTMQIEPGESLSENRLAGELGISRTPVREALNRLEQEGLVISSGRRKRAFAPTIREIENIFDLKIAIESDSASWAAARAGEKEKRALAEVVASMTRVAAARPADEAGLEPWHHEWLSLDIRFHEILFAMTGNSRAKQIIDTLNAYWHRLRLGILAIEDRIEKAEGEHRAIADAVLAGQGERAAELMREHLRALKTMLVGIMRAFHYPG